jgi:hypothetical protein
MYKRDVSIKLRAMASGALALAALIACYGLNAMPGATASPATAMAHDRRTAQRPLSTAAKRSRTVAAV